MTEAIPLRVRPLRACAEIRAPGGLQPQASRAERPSWGVSGTWAKTGLIPDVSTIPGIVIGLVTQAAVTGTPPIEAALGILIGGGVFFPIIVLNRAALVSVS